MKKTLAVALLAALAFAAAAPAVPTENLGVRALPAPGKVQIDGRIDDWDLTGGIFACDDPETQRDQFAVVSGAFLHAHCLPSLDVTATIFLET